MNMGGPAAALPSDMPSSSQTYCLRWNNHKSNLVEILTALLRIESYVDCTIVVDEHVQFKAHRVVLAANSPYFQTILQGLPMDHSIIICPGVKATEMRILLEYMYTGSANVTKEQIHRIMRIAVELEIKGLYDMVDLRDRYKRGHRFNEVSAFQYIQQNCPLATLLNGNNDSLSSSISSPYLNDFNINSNSSNGGSPPGNPTSSSSPNQEITSYRNGEANLNEQHVVVKSEFDQNNGNNFYEGHSPAHIEAIVDGNHYSYPWQITSSAAAAMLTSAYESATEMNPSKRKKVSSTSSTSSNSDTPILRNVLAKPTPSVDEATASNADDVASVSTVARASDMPESQPIQIDLSGNEEETTADNSPDDQNPDDNDEVPEEDKRDSDASESSETEQSVEEEAVEEEAVTCAQAPRPTKGKGARPEWKRYKQYTRLEIQSAIQCVRDGMSALQASRKYGVPARTLYDKVKKLGITTSRVSNRGKRVTSPNDPKLLPVAASTSDASAIATNYANATTIAATAAVAAAAAMYEGVMNEQDAQQLQQTINTTTAAAALLDPLFLQQAIESHANAELSGRSALHAMALAAAAHAAMHSSSTSPNAEPIDANNANAVATFHGFNGAIPCVNGHSFYMNGNREVEDLSLNRSVQHIADVDNSTPRTSSNNAPKSNRRKKRMNGGSTGSASDKTTDEEDSPRQSS